MNRIQKLLAANLARQGISAKPFPSSGSFISIQPDHVLSNDNTYDVIQRMAAPRISNSKQAVISLDAQIEGTNKAMLEKYEKVRDFAAKNLIDFYAPHSGIGHSIMVEQGYAFPNGVCVAADPLANLYGGVGALGLPVLWNDVAAIWKTGKTWLQVPRFAKVTLTGTLASYATSKDVILTLCGLFNRDQVLGHAIEFHGDGIKYLSISDRLAISSMTSDWGATAGVFPVDRVLLDWYYKRSDHFKHEHPRINPQSIKGIEVTQADENAFYHTEIALDLSGISPHVAGPNTVKKMSHINELFSVKISKAFLSGCSKDDIERAAAVLKGRKVHESVKFYVSAASNEVLNEVTASGAWNSLQESGATLLSCGSHDVNQLVEPHEVAISSSSASSRDQIKDADWFVASPETVAASAITGYINSPINLDRPLKVTVPNPEIKSSIKINLILDVQTEPQVSNEAQPHVIQGKLMFLPHDNITTEMIFSEKHSESKQLDPQDMARLSFESISSKVAQHLVTQPSTVLVAGKHFGIGKSREDAVLCLKHAGVKAIVCESIDTKYARNALNHGIVALELPGLVREIRKRKESGSDVIRDLGNVTVDFICGKLTWEDKEFRVPTLQGVALEIARAGGLDQWINQAQAER